MKKHKRCETQGEGGEKQKQAVAKSQRGGIVHDLDFHGSMCGSGVPDLFNMCNDILNNGGIV